MLRRLLMLGILATLLLGVVGPAAADEDSAGQLGSGAIADDGALIGSGNRSSGTFGSGY